MDDCELIRALGVLLLSNRFVPLALAVVAPVVVNIFAFHAFLAPSGVGLAVVIVALEVYLGGRTAALTGRCSRCA